MSWTVQVRSQDHRPLPLHSPSAQTKSRSSRIINCFTLKKVDTAYVQTIVATQLFHCQTRFPNSTKRHKNMNVVLNNVHSAALHSHWYLFLYLSDLVLPCHKKGETERERDRDREKPSIPVSLLSNCLVLSCTSSNTICHTRARTHIFSVPHPCMHTHAHTHKHIPRHQTVTGELNLLLCVQVIKQTVTANKKRSSPTQGGTWLGEVWHWFQQHVVSEKRFTRSLLVWHSMLVRFFLNPLHTFLCHVRHDPRILSAAHFHPRCTQSHSDS